jgi:hypothetical protein
MSGASLCLPAAVEEDLGVGVAGDRGVDLGAGQALADLEVLGDRLPIDVGEPVSGGSLTDRRSVQPSASSDAYARGVDSRGSAGSPTAGVSSSFGPRRYQRALLAPSPTTYPSFSAVARSRLVAYALRPVTRW